LIDPRRIYFRIKVIFATLCLISCFTTSIAQEAAYFALQRAGQGNLAIDKARKIAYITDLGKSGDGDRVTIDGIPLLDSLVAQKIKTLVFTCSHPHSDHAGGIRALFENPQVFFYDANRKLPRFDSIVVVENETKDSLFSILAEELGSKSAIKLTRVDATERNGFTGLSRPDDDVYIESIPYKPTDKAGPHGRTIVTHFVLGRKYSNVDFDDASSQVIVQTVDALKSKGIRSIDSFVVPHHGSAYHDIEPILSLSPKTAIITVNPRNPYGHPSPAILISLMDRLGPQNVFFTGSVDHVVLGPDGVRHARYSANQAESFNLFVRPSYEREQASNNPTALALYRQLESRMVAVPSSHHSETKKDEIAVTLEAAEGANADLLSIADKLALGTSLSPKDKARFENSVRTQLQRLDVLQKNVENYEQSEKIRLPEERSRIKRLFLQLQADRGSPSNAIAPTQSPNSSTLSALSQAVAIGIESLLSSVSEPAEATRNVTDARYVAPTDSVRFGQPAVSEWTNGQVKVPLQKANSYSEMEHSPTIEARPGGIAIGNFARADAGVSLDEYVLTFDTRRDLLLLKGPNHTEILLEHKIAPSTLKALYRFAASDRSAVVSIEGAGHNETVRLDPSFVDTQVGREFIAADLVAGDLAYYDWFHDEDKSFNERLRAAKKDFWPCIQFETVMAGTWFDNPTVIHRRGSKLSLTGNMRLEFVIEAKEPSEYSCKGMLCKDSPPSKGSAAKQKFCHLTPLERFVEENPASVAERFPSVDSMNE
jgi:hypothetical protein